MVIVIYRLVCFSRHVTFMITAHTPHFQNEIRRATSKQHLVVITMTANRPMKECMIHDPRHPKLVSLGIFLEGLPVGYETQLGIARDHGVVLGVILANTLYGGTARFPPVLHVHGISGTSAISGYW